MLRRTALSSNNRQAQCQSLRNQSKDSKCERSLKKESHLKESNQLEKVEESSCFMKSIMVEVIVDLITAVETTVIANTNENTQKEHTPKAQASWNPIPGGGPQERGHKRKLSSPVATRFADPL